VRHVQWVAITWQLDSALTEGYITFSKGFMWCVIQHKCQYEQISLFSTNSLS
jgi:hypothetical protein